MKRSRHLKFPLGNLKPCTKGAKLPGDSCFDNDTLLHYNFPSISIPDVLGVHYIWRFVHTYMYIRASKHASR